MRDMIPLLPEIFLVITAFLLLIDGVTRKTIDTYHLKRYGNIGVAALIIAFILSVLLHQPTERLVLFNGHWVQDDFTYFTKNIVLLGSAAVLCLSLLSLLKEQLLTFEYVVFILLATLGMLLMLSANDLISLFISLEIQGLCLYILAALQRDHAATAEAALKYFVLGSLATALYLYGASLLYGACGNTGFDNLATEGLPVTMGLIFIIAALAFKASAVPFHMWTPDVYQGCPTPVTAFIATTPKITAVFVLMRLLIHPFIELHDQWTWIVQGIAGASLLVGTFAALCQTNIKRLLAYSAIAHMGYALMGVATGSTEGIQSVFVYLILYLVTITGVFGCLLSMRGKGAHNVESVDDLKGLATLHPRTSFCFALFMFSLAGIPPLAGFFGKLYIFKAALGAGLNSLVIVGALTSVVAAYYYLRIVKTMYFEDVPAAPLFSYGQTIITSTSMAIVLKICVLITLMCFFYPTPLLQLIYSSAASLGG